MRKILILICGALLLASCKLSTDGAEDKEYINSGDLNKISAL